MPKVPAGLNVVVPVGVGSSFWFWLYVELEGSAGNAHSCWQAELQFCVDEVFSAAPCAYQPVRPYGHGVGAGVVGDRHQADRLASSRRP